MSAKILYTAEATAKGGCEGHVHSDDGAVDLVLDLTEELGGPGGRGANPELLFAAGDAACRAAKDARVMLGPGTQVTTRVKIGPRDEGGFGLAGAIDAHLDGVERAQAEAIVRKVHGGFVLSYGPMLLARSPLETSRLLTRRGLQRRSARAISVDLGAQASA
jgi:Ohr subfamily peroxiredoxin